MPKKILLIESNASLVREMTSSLEGKGFEVLQTADGKEGIDLARTHSPELIVLCVELPNPDHPHLGRGQREDLRGS